jgi:hypothetical protein
MESSNLLYEILLCEIITPFITRTVQIEETAIEK